MKYESHGDMALRNSNSDHSTATLFLLSIVCCTSSRLAADTVYYGTGADSRVFAANVLVREDLTRPDRAVFWYHDSLEQPSGLKLRSCESAKCRVVKSSGDEQHALVESWKTKGAVSITSHSGSISTVYDLVFRTTAPPGYVCSSCDPQKMAYEYILLSINGVDRRKIEFDAIRSIKFVTPYDLDVELRTGEHVSGHFVVDLASIGLYGGTRMRAIFTGWQQLDSNTLADFTIIDDQVNTIEFRSAVLPLANRETGGTSTGTVTALPIGLPTSLSGDRSGQERSVKDEIDSIRTHEHLPAPRAQRVGVTVPSLSGKTTLTFKNSTVYELYVFLDGVISQKLTLAPGSSQAIDVSGGVFHVAGRVNGANVLPFYGEETYASSAKYLMEFYIASGEKR